MSRTIMIIVLMCVCLVASLCPLGQAAVPPGLDSRTYTGYAIVTTLEIASLSAKLAEFIAHKESLGFDVQVITELDFGGGIGDQAAENIRRWLQHNYGDYNIEYVLLVGDPRPDIGEVPMKLLWPEGPNREEVPSDLYYADLTGNWNLDGDIYYLTSEQCRKSDVSR